MKNLPLKVINNYHNILWKASSSFSGMDLSNKQLTGALLLIDISKRTSSQSCCGSRGTFSDLLFIAQNVPNVVDVKILHHNAICFHCCKRYINDSELTSFKDWLSIICFKASHSKIFKRLLHLLQKPYRITLDTFLEYIIGNFCKNCYPAVNR